MAQIRDNIGRDDVNQETRSRSGHRHRSRSFAAGPGTGTRSGWYVGGSIGESEADESIATSMFLITSGFRPGANGTIEATGFNIAAIGAIPVTSAFSLFGKVGIFSWEAEANDTTAGAPFSATFDGNDLFFGLGAS